jgi:cytochrome c-type biogenesis protein CcmH
VAERALGGHAVPTMKPWLCVVLGLSFVVSAPLRASAQEHADSHVELAQAAPGEKELLGRLVAPCCWNQTLDIHGGAAPDALRAEIRERLTHGESASSIEADLVARYGERVRAQSSSAALGAASLGVIALTLLVGLGLGLKVRRWLRTSARNAGRVQLAAAQGVALAPDALDARLDDELRALD